MNKDEFQKLIDEDLYWRKKEISELISIVNSNTSIVIYKSGILLIYAHWEGFIKNATKLYIKYISDKKIQLNLLTNNFKAISLKGVISECFKSHNTLTMNNEIKFMDKFNDENKLFNTRINLESHKDKDIIDTESKLTSTVFKNIVKVVGLEYKNAYESREQYIDTNLIDRRNAIGHGSKISNNDSDLLCDVDMIEELKQLKNLIFIILDELKENLFEYVEKEYFLKSNSLDKEQYDDLREIEFKKALNSIE